MSTDMDQVAVPGDGDNLAIPHGLASPPESNNAARTDGASDSELSDAEFTEDDPIEPDHYADDGRVPVFKPTAAQFKNFNLYMDKINPYGMRSGIVKVIPPPEWKAALPPLDDAIKTIRVKEPIKQEIMGNSGTYRQANILHQRSYNLPQWRQLCDQSEHQPPAKRGERRTNTDKVRPPTKPKGSSTSTGAGTKKRGPGRPLKGKPTAVTVETENGTPDRLPTPVSPKVEDDNLSIKQEVDDTETPEKPKGGRQAKAISVSSRRKNNRREATAMVDEAAFKDFKYELEGEDYSPERCEELERHYWRTLTYAPPLYGADMPGSLFDEKTEHWNLGKLPNILDHLGGQIPGVNTAYLYLGMWKATFAWHLEDVDLYSINYLHFGAPKQWYSISQGDARRFEAAMKSIWPADAKACDQFLRHKTFLISPQHLLQNFNIKVNKIVHRPGEFIITFPYGYHSGYNLGYNCAEAVNFGLPSWIEYGKVAKKCDCSQAQDSVWIDVRDLERKINGEETEYETDFDEDEEEEEEEENGPSDLPTPPESSGDTKIKTKAPHRKRKRNGNGNDDQQNVKRIRMRIKAATKEPCVLCPNDIPSEPLVATEDGQQAHRICAQYIPETVIESENGEIVTGIKDISKARLDLKCNYCRSKKGACFQCSKRKCTRAYHATCAAAAGVFVEQGEIPVFGEDGTEYKEWAIEFSCRFHRNKRDKKFDGEALEEDARIKKGALDLQVGEVCQMQYYKGDIFAGIIVENRKGEETILVDILPRGDRVEVEYKWILIPEASWYTLPKPSEKAIPMPTSRSEKASLNTSKRQADDIPRAEDAFVKGCTWAEFNTVKLARNSAQVKVDLSKENQIWYYLGKNSTEAKAQFTEDLRNPRHNPKGHFLDTIPKAVAPISRLSYAASYPSTPSQKQSSATSTPSTAIVTPTPQITRHPPQTSLSNSASNRPEKPYVYKPRTTSTDTYRVDPQAYLSQQTFLKQSAIPRQYGSTSGTPLNFGTDPRFQNTEKPSPTPQTSIILPEAVPMPTPTPTPTSTAHNHYVPPPPPRQIQSVPPPRSVHQKPSPLAPPNTSYRPQALPPKGNNPFSSRSASSARVNPFAKYTYLQVEHNRSPLEYKSPYRPGGGFMNGYQGSLQAHLQATLFANRPGSGGSSGSPLPSSISAYTGIGAGARRPSYSNGQPSYSSISTCSPQMSRTSHTSYGPTYGSPVPSAFTTHSRSSTSRQNNSSPKQTTKPEENALWQKRDNVTLHPAIRQQYNTMFHNHQSPPQQQSQQPSNLKQHQSPSYQPTDGQSSQAQHAPQTPQVAVPQQNSQPHQPEQTSHQSQAKSHIMSTTLGTTPPYSPLTQREPNQQADIPSQYPCPSEQETKSLYPHQQYIQAAQPAQVHPQTYDAAPQPRDLPDVPVDSESLIEDMLKSLRKVPSTT
ncbi:hypothetical protein ACMFMG_006696 [Clarireedia jacksonii]